MKQGLLLSNINMDPLLDFISTLSVRASDYNSLFGALTQYNSQDTIKDDMILIYLDLDELLSDPYVKKESLENIELFLTLLNQAVKANPDKLFLCNMPFFAKQYISGLISDVEQEQNPQNLLLYFQKELINLSHVNANIVLYNAVEAMINVGRKKSLNSTFWYIGRIKFSNDFLSELGNIIDCTVNAYQGKIKKVLLLDLDNTLWGGIVGEAGCNGVLLSEDGIGKCYRDLQKLLLELKRYGVLLAVCSKNNEEDAKSVFEKNPMSLLKLNDFVSFKANWETKPDNIKNIAAELNLGLDSFVFIDDSKYEKDIVETSLPEVTVCLVPSRPEEIYTWFINEVVYKYFPKLTVTTEDEQKTKQYQNSQKRVAFSKSVNLDEYLERLDIKLDFQIDNLENSQRVAQLCQKTNQFNLTIKRHTHNDILGFMNDQNWSVIAVGYEDRFGKEGIVGAAIIDWKNEIIDSFLLSCRVIGRNVEYNLIKEIVKIATDRNITQIKGSYIPSQRNQIAENFYESAGFKDGVLLIKHGFPMEKEKGS